MSAVLSSIACALLGLAVGAALQRWGDGERKLHGHKGPMARQKVAADKELSIIEMLYTLQNRPRQPRFVHPDDYADIQRRLGAI